MKLVMAAVNFNHKVMFKAQKVYDVPPKWNLAAKLAVGKIAIP